MKNIFIIGLLLISVSVMGQNYRKEFLNATASKEAADAFFKSTENIGLNAKPLQLAYKGAALVISGKYLSKIGEKARRAKEGIGFIENAVQQDPENIEVRLIRLSIQENIPKILNYRKNIEEDRKFLVKGAEKLPSGALKTFVEDYLNKR